MSKRRNVSKKHLQHLFVERLTIRPKVSLHKAYAVTTYTNV